MLFLFKKMYSRTLFRVIKGFVKPKTRLLSSQPYKVILNEPEFDYDYLLNPDNKKEIEENITSRKLNGDINKVHELHHAYEKESSPSKKDKILQELIVEAHKIPNKYDPEIKSYGDKPKIVKAGKKKKHLFNPKSTTDLIFDLRLGRTVNTSPISGPKSYFFCGDLAELELSLIRHSLERLSSKNFKLVSVPDILPSEIIERCGQATQSERSPVYFLEHPKKNDLCLSGTAEMALGGLVCNTTYDVKDLPVCLTAVSRCYRQEGSSTAKEPGIYRVHNFTKVEMFAIAHPDNSSDLLQNFLNIQVENFESLGLDFQILDMNLGDMGPSAYRKFDVEAWFPAMKNFGEISSCSNCTDYQARRLNIKIKDGDKTYHAHTVNGTACAIPRIIMAICETHQQLNGNIKIPESLRKYFNGRQEISKQKSVGKMNERHDSGKRSITVYK